MVERGRQHRPSTDVLVSKWVHFSVGSCIFFRGMFAKYVIDVPGISDIPWNACFKPEMSESHKIRSDIQQKWCISLSTTAGAMFEWYIDILHCKPISWRFEHGQISYQSLFFVPAGTLSSTLTCQNLINGWTHSWGILKSGTYHELVARFTKRTSTNCYFSLSPYPRADTTTMSLDSTRDSSYAQIPWPRVEGQGSSNPENRHVQPRRWQTNKGEFRKPCSDDGRGMTAPERRSLPACTRPTASRGDRSSVGKSNSVDDEECKILSGIFKAFHLSWM